MSDLKPTAIRFDSAFEKQWQKYVKKLTPREQNQLKEKLSIFKENIFDKRLKTHRLKGNLKDYFAFSISYSNRIVFRLLEEDEVLFIEIGSHDICY